MNKPILLLAIYFYILLFISCESTTDKTESNNPKELSAVLKFEEMNAFKKDQLNITFQDNIIAYYDNLIDYSKQMFKIQIYNTNHVLKYTLTQEVEPVQLGPFRNIIKITDDKNQTAKITMFMDINNRNNLYQFEIDFFQLPFQYKITNEYRPAPALYSRVYLNNNQVVNQEDHINFDGTITKSSITFDESFINENSLYAVLWYIIVNILDPSLSIGGSNTNQPNNFIPPTFNNNSSFHNIVPGLP